MKKILILILLILTLTEGLAYAQKLRYTRPYQRRNGTYVQGYTSTWPNSTVTDNYSYRGNYNPWTGSSGTNSYQSSPSSGHYNPYFVKTNLWGQPRGYFGQSDDD